MSENLKTGIYVGVALLVLLVAIAVWPRTHSIAEQDLIGEPLFPEYQNPTVARGMKIVVPDAKTGQFEDFSVARQNNLWVVPSKGNYPVDSPDRLHEAALALVDLEVLGIASEKTADHGKYGVLNPDNSGAAPALPGMGTKVQLTDSQGTNLAELIIGHAQEGNLANRFVRVPGRDTIYVVELSIDPFVTRFQDWIDSNLLGITQPEVTSFFVFDYTGSVEDRRIDPRFSLEAVAAPRPPMPPQQQPPPPPREWRVERFLEKKDGDFVVSQMLPGEELNSETINTMLATVAQLQIVDVVRKPAAMAQQLERSEYFTDTEFAPQLMQYGFLPAYVGENDRRLMFYGTSGELVIGTETGVEYKLCFGRPLSGEEGSTASDLRRYMMVVARLNPSLLPSPRLLPEPTPPTAEESPAAGEETGEEPSTEDPAEPTQPPTLSDEALLAGPPPGVTQEAWDEYTNRLLQVRQINETQLAAHEEQIREAADIVIELNKRFANWFYVISEQEYDRMHLSRTELFTVGEEGMGIEEFNRLRSQPLRHEASAPVPTAPETATPQGPTP